LEGENYQFAMHTKLNQLKKRNMSFDFDWAKKMLSLCLMSDAEHGKAAIPAGACHACYDSRLQLSELF
jgi:hypothetical protein